VIFKSSQLRLSDHKATSLFQEFRGPISHLLMFAGQVHSQSDNAQLVKTAKRVKEILGDEAKFSLIVNPDRPGENLDWDGTILLDPEHILHARYGSSSPSLYFIRPDGYIACCCPLAEEKQLLEYLEHWFVQSKVEIIVS
jgi:hypothetical protein